MELLLGLGTWELLMIPFLILLVFCFCLYIFRIGKRLHGRTTSEHVRCIYCQFAPVFRLNRVYGNPREEQMYSSSVEVST
jgi:hypothetical protein